MFKSIWEKLSKTIMGGAILITFFTIISKILGLLRDRLLASYFGAGSLLDSYYAAFKLPDLIFNTLVLGALASAFIPVFTRVWCQDKIIAVKLANSIFNYLIAAIICLSSILYFTAPWLIPIITPGFNQPTMAQTINFTRIMLLSIVFFTASNVIGGILNSLKKLLHDRPSILIKILIRIGNNFFISSKVFQQLSVIICYKFKKLKDRSFDIKLSKFYEVCSFA